ncbi:uroporphyrinogen-III synthase [Simiduia agarivorans]|uniref:Uroporphyrinogen-III synthase n=1 Tax=Simiduia agarivorans (strain DSM 21679 / JCM 13881 / BCRC 17597 / SA1) TaxID=1117647 RepID=K4KK50_SIMAS|nr:uroporphyrinogen-III synthase [Simiduia agarivorans]AFU99534.1 uroporphyrinogen-III synthase [Simiduia agarivorans SA1 = DSM 21679]
MSRRLWLTRPAAQAAESRAAFAALGFEVLDVPVLAIEPVTGEAERQAIRTRILDFDRYHWAVFVSQNAVREGVAWLSDYWPQLPLHTRYLAIGAATGRALEQAGLPVVGRPAIDSAMNSEALLALPELADLTDQAVLLFRGEGGRTHLADTLSARGARVDQLALYRRVLPDQAASSVAGALAAGDAVLTVHSGESLDNLCQTLANQQALEACLTWPLVVPGERVAALAETRGFRHITVAVNASDNAMAEALQSLGR